MTGRSIYSSLAERLLANSFEWEGCWLWSGVCTADGYGRISVWIRGQGRRVLQAHRVSYETFIGPIPPDHDLDHAYSCVGRNCIHPNHLTPKPWLDHRRNTAFKRANPPKQLILWPATTQTG